MPKQVVAKVKLHVPGAQATPAPPVGTALGPHGRRRNVFAGIGFYGKTHGPKPRKEWWSH